MTLQQLPPSALTREQALRTLAQYAAPRLRERAVHQSIEGFAQEKFFIPQTQAPIRLMPHQKAILGYALDPNRPYRYGGTVIYSTTKKSGKTAIAAVVGRWIAETWGHSNEVYSLANDMEQARGRIYDQILKSIEIDPNYVKIRQSASLGWKIIERQALYEPNSTFVKALSSDYAGAAGSNPTATLWSELWAYTSTASRRLWEELTPVPTRAQSIRFVETYAGFEGESDLLYDLYKLGLTGRRLTHDDIDWPYDDQPPIWVNDRARLFMYWDSGDVAHRMPWQTPEYYETQAHVLRPDAFERLHRNMWVSSSSSFIPLEWWTRLKEPLPPLDIQTPVVIGVDASVSGDCTALVGVSRDPRNPTNPMIRFYDLWTPSHGQPMDLSVLDARLREYCARYNVVELAYDAYQLHKLMTDLRNDAVAWCKPFSQNAQREIADKQLFDLIRDRRIPHNVGEAFDEQIKNAAAKSTGDVTRLRIVKKGNDYHVDLIVATSMAVYEALRLNLS